MKKIFFFIFTAAFLCVPVMAGDDPLAGVHRSLKDEAFVIETDEESGSESLNRIAGDIDLGFTTPDQEYESTSQHKPGPFGREDIENQTSQRY